jgi:hypothetical protein
VRVADGSLDVIILLEVLPGIMGDRIDSVGQLRCRRFGSVPGLSGYMYTNHTIYVCVEVAKANRSPSIGILHVLSASYNSPRHPLNS